MDTFLNYYFSDLKSKLKLIISDLDDETFESIQADIISKMDTDNILQVVLDNNYRQTQTETNVLKLLNYIYDKKPNISGYGTLFNHKENIPARVIQYFSKERKIAKHKMFSHANDADKTLYNNYDMLQKVIKVLANSYYGVFGQSSFQFFNPYLGPSVTQTGQFITISAILAFEGFMTNNYSFLNMNEFLTYINNIKTRPITKSPKKLISSTKISMRQVVDVMLSKFSIELTEDQVTVVESVISNLSNKELELVFFRNNLYDFLNLAVINDDGDLCSSLILNSFHEDFLDPNSPPEDVKDTVNELWEWLNDYVVYDYQYSNKLTRITDMLRKCIIISDTDSTFLNMEPTISWFSDTFDVKISEVEKLSIINIFVYVITKLVRQVFDNLTTNMNFAKELQPLIEMKSEFNYSRIILTKNKKQYAGKILLQEGVLFTKPKYDIKGLSIKKIGTPKVARDAYERILVEDMLDSETINPSVVFKKIVDIERRIEKSITSGSTEFTKPARYNGESKYKNPISMQVVKGVRLWNFLFGSEFTIPEAMSVNLAKLKPLTLEQAKEAIDEKYHSGLENYFNSDEQLEGTSITVIAIPKSYDTIPEAIIPLLDVETVVNDIIKPSNVLLESIGFTILKSNSFEVASNIINI
jgi:DNA polymerase elongation subunit (family B)